jgi:pyridoxine 4-dehydrogenase
MKNTTPAHQTYHLGGALSVNRIGFGAMRLSGYPGNFGPYADWEAGIALLQHAQASGVNFFDSAHSYGPEWTDKLLGEALGVSDAILATKGGIEKPAPDRIVVNGSPDALRRHVERALINLRRDSIDLFQLHRIDPEMPLEISVAALAKLREEGLIKHIGLSNVDIGQVQRAMTLVPIASVQNRFNSAERGADDLVDFTAKNGIAFIPYGPLGAHPMQRGAKLEPTDALAWLLRRSPNVIVIPGTTNRKHLDANIAAWSAV